MQIPTIVSSLELNVEIFGNSIQIHPVLLWDQNGATLVDTGFPGTFTALRQAIEEKIPSINQIKRIIITHQDWDHTGTVQELLRLRMDHIEVLAHAEECPYLEGTIPHCKLTPERIAARIQSLPEFMREEAALTFNNLPQFPVHHPLQDKDVLPFHGGIEVIHVPGHTPGNICLYVKSRRLLLAGDQLRVEGAALVGPAPEHTLDMTTARESLKKLLHYDIDYVLCYHGGFYATNPTQKIAEIINQI